MKLKLFIITFLIFLTASLSALDPIHDDIDETNIHALHSKALLTYGAHTNTFHLRYYFLRYDLTIQDGLFEGVRFFATANGYRDTHIPETNYGFILPNIQLYDLGIKYRYSFVLL